MADVPMGFFDPLSWLVDRYLVTSRLHFNSPQTSTGGAPETISFINRVWDTAAGPAFVRWTTGTPDPSGSSYPGPGTFGVDTSDYTVEYREE